MFNNHELKKMFAEKIIVDGQISSEILDKLEYKIEGLYFTEVESELIEKALSLGNMHRLNEWEDHNLLEIQKRFVNSSSYIKRISNSVFISELQKQYRERKILDESTKVSNDFFDKSEQLWLTLKNYLFIYEKLGAVKRILGQEFINSREKSIEVIVEIIKREAENE